MLLEQPSGLSLLPLARASMPGGRALAAAGDGSTDLTFAAELSSQLPPLPGTPRLDGAVSPPTREIGTEEQEKIHGTAQQLESLMLYQLLKQMWDSIPESGLLPAGNAGKMYREMWLEQVANQASQSGGGIGIARLVEQQLDERARHSFTPEQAAARRSDT